MKLCRLFLFSEACQCLVFSDKEQYYQTGITDKNIDDFVKALVKLDYRVELFRMKMKREVFT